MNQESQPPRIKEKEGVKEEARQLPPSVITESKTYSGLVNTEVRRGRGEMILVIDDEIGVREVMRSLLKIMGFLPLIAEDGVKGVALYIEHQQQIKIIITDMMMPNIQGPEVIRQIRLINPDARIVAMGGLVHEQTDLVEEPGRLAFLHKPMTGAELLEVLCRVMPLLV